MTKKQRKRASLPVDEHGRDARYQDWVDTCGNDCIASNGERVTSALALTIAADVIHACVGDERSIWTNQDMRLALGVIAGIRAQRDIFGPDADALGMGEVGLYATEQIDIWVYG